MYKCNLNLHKLFKITTTPANIYLLKVSNRNSKKGMKYVFIVNFEHISFLFLLFLLLTLNK